jgi:hypothetical protein
MLTDLPHLERAPVRPNRDQTLALATAAADAAEMLCGYTLRLADDDLYTAHRPEFERLTGLAREMAGKLAELAGHMRDDGPRMAG